MVIFHQLLKEVKKPSHVHFITNVLFSVQAKLNSQGLAPLMFRIRYKKQVAQLSTGYFIKPKDWNQEKNQVKPSNPDAVVINQHLKDLELKSYQYFSKMFHAGDVYLNNIIDKLKGLDIISNLSQ